MTHPPAPTPPAASFSSQSLSVAAAVAATGYGILLMIGWSLGIEVLEAGLLPAIVVKPNAAIGLALLGAGLILAGRRGARTNVGIVLISIAGLIGILTVAEYALGVDFGIDNAVFREAPGAPETKATGRMALGAAVGLTLLASAGLATVIRLSRAAAGLALLGATLAGFSLLGRLYGSIELADLGGGTAIAPGMALGLAVVAIGILANPSVGGPGEVLARRSAGGRLARRFALASLIVLPGLGALAAIGATEHWFGFGFGVALVVAAGAAALIVVGAFVATWYDQVTEKLRAEADARETRRRREQLLAEFLAGSPAADNEHALLDDLVARAAAELKARCLVLRPTHDRAILTVVASAGGGRASLGAQPMSGGEDLAGRAFTTGKAQLSPLKSAEMTGRQSTSTDPINEAATATGQIAVPLRVSNDVIGVVSLARHDEAPFEQADLEFCLALASRAAIGLERLSERSAREREAREARVIAQFVEAATEAGDEVELLERLSQSASDAVDASLAIYRLGVDGNELETVAFTSHDDAVEAFREMYARQPWRASEGIMGLAISSGETVFRPYMALEERRAYLASLPEDRRPEMEARDLRAIVAIPLSEGGRRLGVLSLERYGPDAEAFTERDRTFAESLAARANVALSRISLVAERDRASRLMRAMFEASPLATQLLRADGTVVLWNPAAERLFGFTAEEAIGGQPPGIPPDEVPAALEMARRLVRGETVAGQPARRLRKDGAVIEVELYGAQVADERDEMAIVGIYADVTERNRLVREIRRTSETLRVTLEASPLPIITVDDSMRVTFWNGAAERVYGWTAAEVLGSPPPLSPVDDADLIARSLERLRAGETLELDASRRTKSGATLDVQIHSVALRDEAGQFVGVLAIHENVTGRKRLEAELLQAQKMEAIGRLAAGVAHDINNSLTGILGYASLARSAAPGDLVDYLASIEGSAERSATLARQLLAFGEKQMLRPKAIDPSVLIGQIEPRLRQLTGATIDVRVSSKAPGAMIEVDPDSFSQVLTDLVANARDAMPTGGTVTITTELVAFDASDLARHFGVAEGTFVAISVTDAGMGMSPETKSHLFEPFFSTKPFGGSAGLGLAAAYGAVKQANGQIHVYSEPEIGTTFRLYFPVIAAARSRTEDLPLPASGRRVLLVEDEPALAELLTTVLGRGGYDVTAVRTRREAVERLETSVSFDLLVSDIALGTDDGRDLARLATSRIPTLRVVLMSGFAEESFGAREELPADAFVAKPFNPTQFLRVVDALMADPGHAG